MDSLTQIVLGASVGEAVLGKKAGNKAILYGAIAGTIPDLDTFAGLFTGPITAIEWHRGLTHSIFFTVIAAPLLGFLISRIERRSGISWTEWSKLMFWGLLTHPILDAFTTWGTKIFWPLDTRVAIKSVFVIDPLYTVPFLVFLILAMRQRKGTPLRRKYNNLALTISTAYLCLGLVLKGVAYNNFMESLEKQGIFYKRIETRPTPFNIILWTANVETSDAYLTGFYSFFDSDLVRFTDYPKNHTYLGTLRDNPKILRLIRITKGWYTLTSKNGKLFFNDLRFGKMNPWDPDSGFVFSYEIVPDGSGVIVKEAAKDTRTGKAMLGDLWIRIWGN